MELEGREWWGAGIIAQSAVGAPALQVSKARLDGVWAGGGVASPRLGMGMNGL